MLISQPDSAPLHKLYRADPDLMVWWATELECVSAIARLEREDELTARAAANSLERLERLQRNWNEVEPTEPVRSTARRLLRTQELRSADAQHLAAAIIASEGMPESMTFVALDRRLVRAAEREGLAVLSVD